MKTFSVRMCLLLLPLLAGGCATAARSPVADAAELARLAGQVEVRRTTHGVPHILADDLRAAAFALAYVQLEDHGESVIRGMIAARGQLSLVEGPRRIDADAQTRLAHARAVEAFDLLGEDTREVYHGFAAGMNHFIRTHRNALPDWAQPDFTAEDVLARDVRWPSSAAMDRFRRRLLADPDRPPLLVQDADGAWRAVSAQVGAADASPEDATSQAPDNVGSNAFALAPGRTTSGDAILLRNPHLSWSAGYYEAHVRVPGKLDFYGDFRIGGPFTVIGGFNPELGFSTTNNATRTHEFYALRLDPARVDHYVLDGASRPLRRQEVRVEYRDSTGRRGQETREFWSTEHGPVIHRGDSLLYVYRPVGAGNHLAGEQWLEMMKAQSLEEWRDAMRIGARMTSNFTYADRAGNILYVWVSGAPVLPHPDGGDTLAIRVTRAEQIWTRQVAFDSLPQLLNPPGGYVQNANDSPHYANLNRILRDTFPFWVEPPQLRLRSQHALQLLHNERVFSLEDVVAAKHSMRMLLADRVKPDLLAAVAASAPTGETARALELLARWDNGAAADSRGALLFQTWWDRYRTLRGGEPLYAVAWSPAEPASTPHGLADADVAREAFEWAVPETARRFGSIDAAWGDVHRVQRGDVDAPVGGCGGALGCFRVLNFSQAEDGRRIVDGGDGWVLAVEFGERPRAYSILAYGQSPDPASPYHDDQAALFAANRMKPVAWTEAEIAAALVERYRPGQEPPRR